MYVNSVANVKDTRHVKITGKSASYSQFPYKHWVKYARLSCEILCCFMCVQFVSKVPLPYLDRRLGGRWTCKFAVVNSLFLI